MKPAKPRALVWRDDDPVFLQPTFECQRPKMLPAIVVEGEYRFWLDLRHILQLEKHGLLPREGADHARAAEVMSAWHEWQRGLERARQESGFAAAEDRVKAVIDEADDVYQQMLELKPTSLEGFRALALAIVENCWFGKIERGDRAADRGVAVIISALTGVPVIERSSAAA
jgi:hypothetical protein